MSSVKLVTAICRLVQYGHVDPNVRGDYTAVIDGIRFPLYKYRDACMLVETSRRNGARHAYITYC